MNNLLIITNLTNNPVDWIQNKYIDAFEEILGERGVKIPTDVQDEYIDNQIQYLEEQAEQTIGRDLMSLIDNFLVNNDYYSDVLNFINDYNNIENITK